MHAREEGDQQRKLKKKQSQAKMIDGMKWTGRLEGDILGHIRSMRRPDANDPGEGLSDWWDFQSATAWMGLV